MVFLLILPMSAFSAVLLFASLTKNSDGHIDLTITRHAIIDSMVIWGGLVWCITEVLGLFNS